jgi:tetratricopeptide (TPR) repeat protein
VLARLVQHPGELVTRDELRQELWPDNTFLDFEHGLNAAIKRLRDALGDSADSPRFIETLPRRGYRFIAPVRREATVADAPPPPVSKPAATASRVRWAAAAVLVGLVAVAAAAWWRSTQVSRGPVQPDPGAVEKGTSRVAVAPFENRTADPSFGPLGDQIAGRVVRAIAEVPGVEAMSESSASGAARGNETADSRRGRVHGASLVVKGALFLHGDRLELQSHVLDGTNGRLLHAIPPFDAPRTDPGPAIERLERQVAGAVAIHFDDFFGGLEFVSQPPTIDGYREYRTGLEIFDWDYPRALAHLQRALEIDPRFWLARVVMYFAYSNTGQAEKAVEQLTEMERERNRHTPAERLFIDFLREGLAGRTVEALRVLRDLEVLMPRSLVVNHNIVQLSVASNRLRAAVEAYDRLTVDVRTYRHSIGTWRINRATQALHLLGEYERELEESRRGQLHAPGMLFFVESEVRALAALGRVDDLQKVVDRTLAMPATTGNAGEVLEEAARALRTHGHRNASLALAGRAVDWLRARPSEVAATTDHQFALGRALSLAERWDEAEQIYTTLAAEIPGAPHFIGLAGVSAARRGNAARARAALQELEGRPDPQVLGRHTFWRARLAAVLGERERAVDLLRAALAQGLVFSLGIHDAPEFDSLREYPPFQELVRPKD